MRGDVERYVVSIERRSKSKWKINETTTKKQREMDGENEEEDEPWMKMRKSYKRV